MGPTCKKETSIEREEETEEASGVGLHMTVTASSGVAMGGESKNETPMVRGTLGWWRLGKGGDEVVVAAMAAECCYGLVVVLVVR